MSRIAINLLSLLFTNGLFVQNNYAQRLPIWEKNIQVVALEDSSDTSIVINHFFATWCKPCLEELPIFDSLARLNSGKIQIEFICLDLENTRGLSSSVAKLKLPGAAYYLAPNATNIKRVSPSWDGTLPFTLIYFPHENTPIEVNRKQTTQSLQQLIKLHEN